MKINSSTYSDFVKNAQVMWRNGYDRVARVASRLYEVSSSDVLTTEHSAIDGFTFARRKAEGDDNRKETPTQNYSKVLTKYRIGLQAEITWEMRKYDKYREIARTLRNLGEATAQRMELDMTHRFTFATATSYTDMDGVSVGTTVGDGLALLSTAHTVPSSSTTFRNRIANNPQISRAGIEAAELLFTSQMIDAAGNKIVIMPNTIIISDDPSTENIVTEYLQSTASVEGANAGVTNVLRSKYSYIKLPYLATTNTGAYDSTKAKMWFLADLTHTDALCEVSEAPHLVAPSAGSNSEDFDNDDWSFKSNAAYAIEIVDPRFIVGSTADGTA